MDFSQFKSDPNVDPALSSQSLDAPINVSQLSEKFANDIWDKYGNSSSEEYIKLWSIIFHTLNECELRNSGLAYNRYFVIPATTGSGKTQCFRFYAAELARQNKNAGMVILSKFTSEVDEAVEQINQIVGREVAVSYYSGTDIKDHHREEELDNYQVVVTTHQYFKLNHHDNAKDKDTYNKVMSYNGHTRAVVVVDEAIDLLDSFTITKDIITKLETKAETIYRKTNSPELGLELRLLAYLDNNYKHLFFADEVKTVCRYVEDKLPTLKRISLELGETVDTVKGLFSLTNFIQAMKAKKLDKVDTISPAQKTKLIKQAESLIHLLDDSLYWYNNQKYISSSLEKPTVSTVLFDATANIEKIYQSMPYVTIVQPLPQVKSYDNVVLHYKELDIGLGGDNIKKNLKRHFDNLCTLYRNVNRQQTNWEDRIVVFTKKELREYTEKQQIPSDIDHFGKLVGVNHYKDDNHILIYGIPYKPKSLHINNLYQAFGDEAFKSEAGGLLAELEHTNISADIIQAINRGRCRKVVDGQAPETHIYLALARRDKQLNKQILSDITTAMPGIQINEWDVDVSDIKAQNKQEINNKFIPLVDNIKELNVDKVKLSSLGGYKELSSKEKRTAYNHLTDKGTSLYAEAKKAGYRCEKDGQYYLIRN